MRSKSYIVFFERLRIGKLYSFAVLLLVKFKNHPEVISMHFGVNNRFGATCSAFYFPGKDFFSLRSPQVFFRYSNRRESHHHNIFYIVCRGLLIVSIEIFKNSVAINFYRKIYLPL